MSLFFKACIGALLVVVIALLSRSKNYYIAGLVPLFPTFSLIAHYMVGHERSQAALKTTILFGMGSMIPYLAYLTSLYFLLDRFSLVPALCLATLCWLLATGGLLFCWGRLVG